MASNSVTFNIILTFSKIMAFLIFIVTAAYAFMYKDSNVLMAGLGIVSVVLTGKQLFDKNKKKQVNQNDNQ